MTILLAIALPYPRHEAGASQHSPVARRDVPPSDVCALAGDSKLRAGVFSSDARVRGEVVLTFDDGPNPHHTPVVLDILADFGVPATFFVVGAAVNRKTYPLIQRMKAEGHEIGSHTYNHDIKLAYRGWDDGDYIVGQYVLGHIMIELALLAQSPDHFDALHSAVFGVPSSRRQTVGSIRRRWQEYRERHESLLQELGLARQARPHLPLLARPPGGLPYISRGPLRAAALSKHERALERLGWLNILWHGGSGDTDPERRHELSFLLGNLHYHTRRGGVLLIHDHMRKDALKTVLRRMRNDPELAIVPLREFIQRKYGCGVQVLADRLQAAGEQSPTAHQAQEPAATGVSSFEVLRGEFRTSSGRATPVGLPVLATSLVRLGIIGETRIR